MANSIITIIVIILTLIVTICLPFIAYPLARMLKQARQAIDDMLNWEDETKEKTEDSITHGAVVLLALAVLILGGLVFTWYVDQYVLEVHVWMYKLIGNAPLIGSPNFGYYNIAPLGFWSILFIAAFLFGWFKSTSEVKHEENNS